MSQTTKYIQGINNIEQLPIDFEEICEVLKERIKTRLPERWTDFLASNFGVELLEAVAYEASLLNYYVNSSVQECFLPTAKTKTAVYRLANTIGYEPHPPSQAIAEVKFYLSKPHTEDIIIPKYTKLSATTGIPFYTTSDAIISAGEMYTSCKVKSGTLNHDSFISTGIPRYRYKLRIGNVSAIEQVLVNKKEFFQTDFIDDRSEEYKNYYTLYRDDTFNTYIIFGDGTYGSNPDGPSYAYSTILTNTLIEVTYVTGADSTHNVSPYAINQVLDIIYDIKNAICDVSVINEQFASGASDAESVASVKELVPSIYRSQNRCVTKQDFYDLTKKINGVGKVNVFDHTDQEQIGIFGVKVCVIPENGGYLNPAFREEIQKSLNKQKIIATDVEVLDPTYIPYDISLGVNVNNTMSKAIIINNIRKTISDHLRWENRNIGEEVSKVKLYQEILQLPEVLYINYLDITESRGIYIKSIIGINDIDKTLSVQIIDNAKILKKNSEFTLLNTDKEAINKTKFFKIVTDIDENGLCKISYDDDSIYSEIKTGYIIYPILTVNENHNESEKKVKIVSFENPAALKFYSLNNISNLEIYFENNPKMVYKILYKNNDYLYLDKKLENSVTKGEKIFITKKSTLHIVDSYGFKGTNILKFKDYPKFSIGATLINKNDINFENKTIIGAVNNTLIEYIDNLIDASTISKILKVYDSNGKEFVLNEDYSISDDFKTLNWIKTNSNSDRLVSNARFYIDLIRKNTESSTRYIVKQVYGKNVQISPNLMENVEENTVFEYTTDTMILRPFEISDVGNITINMM